MFPFYADDKVFSGESAVFTLELLTIEIFQGGRVKSRFFSVLQAM